MGTQSNVAFVQRFDSSIVDHRLSMLTNDLGRRFGLSAGQHKLLGESMRELLDYERTRWAEVSQPLESAGG